MGVSTVGERVTVAQLRHALAIALAFVGLFYYLYGPPITDRMREAAERECNQLTGSTYRNFLLDWKTTGYNAIDRPRWVCYDLRDPADQGTDFGWWVTP